MKSETKATTAAYLPHDVTGARREAVLEALAETGWTYKACARAGVPRPTAWRWRQRDTDFDGLFAGVRWLHGLRRTARRRGGFAATLVAAADFGKVLGSDNGRRGRQGGGHGGQ